MGAGFVWEWNCGLFRIALRAAGLVGGIHGDRFGPGRDGLALSPPFAEPGYRWLGGVSGVFLCLVADLATKRTGFKRKHGSRVDRRTDS